MHLGGGWGILATREDGLTAVCWRLGLYHNSIHTMAHSGLLGSHVMGAVRGLWGLWGPQNPVCGCVLFMAVCL